MSANDPFDPQNTLSDIVERELESLHKAYLEGVELAIFDVLLLCRKKEISIPVYFALRIRDHAPGKSSNIFGPKPSLDAKQEDQPIADGISREF